MIGGITDAAALQRYDLPNRCHALGTYLLRYNKIKAGVLSSTNVDSQYHGPCKCAHAIVGCKPTAQPNGSLVLTARCSTVT